jgi:hypothetical protein
VIPIEEGSSFTHAWSTCIQSSTGTKHCLTAQTTVTSLKRIEPPPALRWEKQRSRCISGPFNVLFPLIPNSFGELQRKSATVTTFNTSCLSDWRFLSEHAFAGALSTNEHPTPVGTTPKSKFLLHLRGVVDWRWTLSTALLRDGESS